LKDKKNYNKHNVIVCSEVKHKTGIITENAPSLKLYFSFYLQQNKFGIV